MISRPTEEFCRHCSAFFHWVVHFLAFYQSYQNLLRCYCCCFILNNGLSIMKKFIVGKCTCFLTISLLFFLGWTLWDKGNWLPSYFEWRFEFFVPTVASFCISDLTTRETGKHMLFDPRSPQCKILLWEEGFSLGVICKRFCKEWNKVYNGSYTRIKAHLFHNEYLNKVYPSPDNMQKFEGC